MPDLDPNYEWLEITSLGDSGPRYIKGQCRHLEQVHVRNIITGEPLRLLCTNCGMITVDY